MSNKLTNDLIDMETLERVVPIIRNAAHPIRLRILDYLQQEGGARNVTQITDCTRASQAIVSQQLRILKDQGILSAKRDGNYILYDIANHSVLALLDCIRLQQAKV
jgi:DNA-binding transcriptional ArsR family regulator